MKIQKVEQAILDSLERNGHSMTLAALDRDPEVAIHLGYGVDAIDVIVVMTSKNLVAYDSKTETVRG